MFDFEKYRRNSGMDGRYRVKRFLSFFMAVVLVLSLAACSAGEEQEGRLDSDSRQQETTAESETQNPEPAEAEPSSAESKILVAYFSWADNAVLEEEVDAVASPSVIPPGNVQQLAGWVQEETGGDLFPIRVADPYPSDWDDCLERANQERGENAGRNLPEDWTIWISTIRFSWGIRTGVRGTNGPADLSGGE